MVIILVLLIVLHVKNVSLQSHPHTSLQYVIVHPGFFFDIIMIYLLLPLFAFSVIKFNLTTHQVCGMIDHVAQDKTALTVHRFMSDDPPLQMAFNARLHVLHVFTLKRMLLSYCHVVDTIHSVGIIIAMQISLYTTLSLLTSRYH